jgi:hypothetical protein
MDGEAILVGHSLGASILLKWATVREFDGRGHQFGDDLSEVARDIEKL